MSTASDRKRRCTRIVPVVFLAGTLAGTTVFTVPACEDEPPRVYPPDVSMRAFDMSKQQDFAKPSDGGVSD